jgi:hypothetical protein
LRFSITLSTCSGSDQSSAMRLNSCDFSDMMIAGY